MSLKKGTDYTEGKWHELTNYMCKRCTFATVSKDQLEEHYRLNHAPPPVVQRVSPTLSDRFGNPLVIEEEAQPAPAPAATAKKSSGKKG